MIEEAVILNFKSIKSAQFSCRRVNIVVGPPNSGRSNLLEALGLFSLFNADSKIHHLVRFQTLHNLFFDNAIQENVHIRTDKHQIRIRHREHFEVTVETQFKGTTKSYDLYYDKFGKLLNTHPHYVSPVNFYHFRPNDFFDSTHPINLKPPFGENLVLMLQTHPELLKIAIDAYKPYGYQVIINLAANSIQLQKEKDGIVTLLPYTLSSLTIQRFIFYLTAIGTNNDSILMFDEPAFHATQEQVGAFADFIANSKSNQFFFTINSPRFFDLLLSKLDPSEVKVIATEWHQDQTIVKRVPEKNYSKVMDERQQQPVKKDTPRKRTSKKAAATGNAE